MKTFLSCTLLAALAVAAAPAAADCPVPFVTHPGYEHLRGTRHPYGPLAMDHLAYREAQGYAWHGYYNYTQWGMPVALVVPPNAERHYETGWGASETRLYRLSHQFNRNYPGTVYGEGFAPRFRHTPLQPSDTRQFGVYPVRAPWD